MPGKIRGLCRFFAGDRGPGDFRRRGGALATDYADSHRFFAAAEGADSGRTPKRQGALSEMMQQKEQKDAKAAKDEPRVRCDPVCFFTRRMLAQA